LYSFAPPPAAAAAAAGGGGAPSLASRLLPLAIGTAIVVFITVARDYHNFSPAAGNWVCFVVGLLTAVLQMQFLEIAKQTK
jgi:hypothetical protein